jgi:hypothetical protein
MRAGGRLNMVEGQRRLAVRAGAARVAGAGPTRAQHHHGHKPPQSNHLLRPAAPESRTKPLPGPIASAHVRPPDTAFAGRPTGARNQPRKANTGTPHCWPGSAPPSTFLHCCDEIRHKSLRHTNTHTGWEKQIC